VGIGGAVAQRAEDAEKSRVRFNVASRGGKPPDRKRASQKRGRDQPHASHAYDERSSKRPRLAIRDDVAGVDPGQELPEGVGFDPASCS
jgi:hypothetical protein